MPREWLVIDNWGNHSVFGERGRYGYIPRDVVEGELAIPVQPDGRCTWFTREQGEQMRAHPMWQNEEP